MPRPSLWPATSSASSRLSRFASGSPMPMTTMLRQPLVRAGQQVPQADELFEDLAGGQVADDAVEPAGAEDAAHAAADLGADAGRPRGRPPGSARTRSAGRRGSRRSSLCVPSADGRCRSTGVPERGEVRPRVRRAGRSGRSVICSNDSARPARTQRRICLARSGGWPRSASHARQLGAGVEHGPRRRARRAGRHPSGSSTMAAIFRILRARAGPGKRRPREPRLPPRRRGCYKRPAPPPLTPLTTEAIMDDAARHPAVRRRRGTRTAPPAGSPSSKPP